MVELSYGDETIEINGRTELFDDIFQSFLFEEPSSSVLPDEPICIQVLAYARSNPESACHAFSTPCDVPDGWESCDE